MGLNTHSRPFGSGTINLSNAGTHSNDGDQHLFEPGVNLMVKRQTRSDLRCIAPCQYHILQRKN